MAANHLDWRLACRTRLLSLSVCTTGSVTLVATATGYTRAIGSFITDGFRVGMEVTPAGFTANPKAVITAVTAQTMTVDASRAVESGASGRSLTVGLPSGQAWEDVKFTPTARKPFIIEQYLPGPGELITLKPSGSVEYLPQYVVQVVTPDLTGGAASYSYADAVLAHFPVGMTLTAADGATLRVRGQPAPFSSQLIPYTAGAMVVTVSIPFRVHISA
jgi:hypothetical protein